MPDLASVVALLDSDRHALPGLVDIIRMHIQALQARQRIMLSAAGERELSDFRLVYGSLDDEHRARVLFSAELGQLLSGSESSPNEPVRMDGARDLVELYRRELAISQFQNVQDCEYLRSTRKSDVRSPMGDRYLKRESDTWQMQRQWLIDEQIAIDFDSPIAQAHEPASGVLSAASLLHTDAEKETIRGKLSLALRNIDTASPEAGQMIRNVIRRIVVRKSVEGSHRFSSAWTAAFNSEYQPDQPGSIRMLNVHHPERTIGGCMEAMYHEAIHIVLSFWEGTHGSLTPPGALVRPVSPWTGNSIPNHSFAHAVFVWYGIHRLFERCMQRAGSLQDVDGDELESRLSLAASGFLLRRPLGDYFTLTAPFNDELGNVITAMQAGIVRIYADAGSASHA